MADWCFSFPDNSHFVLSGKKFDEESGYCLIKYAAGYSKKDISFTFKNGIKIKV